MKVMEYLGILARDVPKVGNARLAAALILDNKIVSVGVNSRKSHPFQAKYGKNKDAIYLHAETAAIKNFLRMDEPDKLSRCTMFVCRVKQSNTIPRYTVWGLARPCIGCQRAIALFNIKKVVYSSDTDKHYQVL